MSFESLKFTLRGIFRDVVRGIPARLFIYPRLKENEFSLSALQRFTRHAQGGSDPDAAKLVLTDSSRCLTKSDVRANPACFIKPRSWRNFLRNSIQTSGTSGEPMTLHQDYMALLKEEAFVHRQLRWSGYRSGDRRAWLRGDIIRPTTKATAAVTCRDWWTNTLFLSSYHISNDTAASYVNTLAKFDPVLLQAYPSSIFALASWMLLHGVKWEGRSLRAIVTSSETLSEEMRTTIEAAFGSLVFDWYGQAERVVAIGTCEHGNRHVLTDYGRTELIPAGENRYELVGTGYNNSAMPLTRYRTGDFVTLDKQSCACKRVFPTVREVLGRVDDVLVLSDGRTIGRLDHVFKGVENMIQGQIAYRSPDQFVLRVVPGPRWSTADEQRLRHNFEQRIERVHLLIELVAAIPRGPNGKTKFVVMERQQ
jgi:phenylacetate-CoA ligase